MEILYWNSFQKKNILNHALRQPLVSKQDAKRDSDQYFIKKRKMIITKCNVHTKVIAVEGGKK